MNGTATTAPQAADQSITPLLAPPDVGSQPKADVSGNARPIDLASLQAALSAATLVVSDDSTLIERVASLLVTSTSPLLLLYYHCRQSGQTTGPEIKRLYGEVSRLGRAGAELCLQTASKSVRTHRTVVHKTPTPVEGWLAAIPIPGQTSECLVAYYSTSNSAQSVAALQLAACHIALGDAIQTTQLAADESGQLAALVDLVSRLDSCDDVDQASGVLADSLKRYLHCEQVIVGLCTNGKLECRVSAISESPTIDPNSPMVRLSQAVLQESIARGDISTWPPLTSEDRHALCAHRQFHEATNGESILSIVLRDDTGEIHGAWLMSGPANQTPITRHQTFALASQKPIAATLRLLTRAQRSRLSQLWDRSRNFATTQKGRTMVALMVVVAAILCIPVRYHVQGECELQPVTQRYLAAPFASRLEKTYVAPGDIIHQGQLLAQLDGQDIRWELAGTEADLHRATKELAGYKVAHETGKADIAQHEVERLTMRAELLKHRVSHLEIHSPIDGIVILGDLKRSEGMPLSMGQTLFEIAPLEKMIVEVGIPEADIRLVNDGMTVRIWLDSFPMQSWDATIARVHPRSEVKDDANIFVAEVPLDNESAKLRPGMRGTAKIATVRKPLGWNLFHQPMASIVRWLGW